MFVGSGHQRRDAIGSIPRSQPGSPPDAPEKGDAEAPSRDALVESDQARGVKVTEVGFAPNRRAQPSASAHLRRRSACARAGAQEEQLALAGVARERCRAFEFRAGLVGTAELPEQIAAHARQEVVAL